MKINKTQIGESVYIIAEMSANHGQDYEKAEALVHAAKDAGADAVKFQTYTPDTITINSDKKYFQIGEGTIWAGMNLYELYGQAYTPWEWQPKLKALADSLGLDCFSTPFDDSAVDFLEEMNVPAHKVASFELVDIGLLKKIASTGKPVIMSTGMATLEEIELAVSTLRKNGCNELALLKCTSAYPANAEDMNLRRIADMAARFKVPCGLSDHTLGITVPIAAVAMGACIIEKHFTLSRDDGGPDAEFSLEPQEFKEMVEAVRVAEKALGNVEYELTDGEKASKVFRRSLFVVEDIKAGEKFTPKNVRSIRPGHGLAPKVYDDVIGKSATCDVARGEPLTQDMF